MNDPAQLLVQIIGYGAVFAQLERLRREFAEYRQSQRAQREADQKLADERHASTQKTLAEHHERLTSLEVIR